MMVDAKYLMDDDMMRDFIVNGYVNLKPEHPKSLHDAIMIKRLLSLRRTVILVTIYFRGFPRFRKFTTIQASLGL